MRIKSLLICVMLLPALLSGCLRKNADEEKTVFRYNESAGITSLDPAFARNQANIWAVNQLFNGLVQLDSTLKIQPCLAKKWEISPDGITYTFTLRNDVYFHDSEIFKNSKGRKLIADDVVYSLQRLASDKLASPGAWVINPVATDANNSKHIKALNDTTVEIKLSRPFPPFAGLLSMQYCSVIPREAIDVYGEEFRIHPVGTGPFVFKMLKEGVKLVLVRNNNYFEKDMHGNALPYIDAVAVSFIIDKQAAFLEFVKGNLDFMSGLDAGYKDEILTPSGKLRQKYVGRIKMLSVPYLNTEYLGFLCDSNNKAMQNSPLNDLRIRQAINIGFDRSKMIRYLRNGIGQPGIRGFIPEGLPGHNQNASFGYNYNPEKAKRLLEEAGYPGGKGLPPIVISTNASYLDLSMFIQSQLSSLGINIKIDVSPPATLRENIAQARVPFFRGSWIADYPDAENYLSLFYSPNKTPKGPNYTHFENKQFDLLYERAGFELNDSIRALQYSKMDSIIMDNAPVVVLFYDQVLRFTGNNIVNLGSNPLNLLDLKRVRKIVKMVN